MVSYNLLQYVMRESDWKICWKSGWKIGQKSDWKSGRKSGLRSPWMIDKFEEYESGRLKESEDV